MPRGVRPIAVRCLARRLDAGERRAELEGPQPASVNWLAKRSARRGDGTETLNRLRDG